MESERRQKLNVMAIRVSLRSSMRDLTADEARRTLERANLLLDQARRVASSTEILTEIDELQGQLDRRLDPMSDETSG
jgi:hypothetical protein